MGEISEGRTWKLVLAYDGADFSGWQIQPDRKTVQGELRAAIERVTGENVLPQGSGRTDAGVHALGQVASFTLSAPIPEANFARALNRTLPAVIRVVSAHIARSHFHARHSAKSKTYEYRIFRGAVCPPWLARYAYAFNSRLDVEAMEQAARRVAGEHDFTSFAARDPERNPHDAGYQGQTDQAGIATEAEPEPQSKMQVGNIRTIYESGWRVTAGNSPAFGPPGAGPGARSVLDACFDLGSSRMPGEWLVYRVRGSGFLHHMVRNLVGTFLEVGRGNLAEADISRILRARARSEAGATAPARGLFLMEVEYSETLPCPTPP